MTYDRETEKLIHALIAENTRLKAYAERAIELLRFGADDEAVDEAIEILEAA